MSCTALPGIIAASRRRIAGTPTVLGYNTKGSQTGTYLSAGQLNVSKFTLASAGTLTELHGWFLSPGFSGQRLQMVVYDDDGTSGAPGTRLVYTSLFSGPTLGDAELSQSGLSVALAAGSYYLGAVCEIGSAGASYRENTGGTHYVVASGAAFNPPPSTFPGGATTGTRKYSFWGIVLV